MGQGDIGALYEEPLSQLLQCPSRWQAYEAVNGACPSVVYCCEASVLADWLGVGGLLPL